MAQAPTFSSVFEKLKKSVYDKEKDGAQMGGIFGGLLGLLGSWVLVSGGGLGALALVPVLLMTGAGIWAGNKINDWRKHRDDPKAPAGPHQSSIPGQAKGSPEQQTNLVNSIDPSSLPALGSMVGYDAQNQQLTAPNTAKASKGTTGGRKNG